MMPALLGRSQPACTQLTGRGRRFRRLPVLTAVCGASDLLRLPLVVSVAQNRSHKPLGGGRCLHEGPALEPVFVAGVARSVGCRLEDGRAVHVVRVELDVAHEQRSVRAAEARRLAFVLFVFGLVVVRVIASPRHRT